MCVSTVPITPGVIPSARNTASNMNVVVVLPFVPVTPTSVSARDGSPKNSDANGPIAVRTEGTMA